MAELSAAALGGLAGAAFGSFLGCAAYRVPRRQSLSGRSRCPGCGEQVRAYQNIPLISYLVLRGRARCCGSALSTGYILFEAAGMTVGTVTAYIVLHH